MVTTLHLVSAGPEVGEDFMYRFSCYEKACLAKKVTLLNAEIFDHMKFHKATVLETKMSPDSNTPTTRTFEELTEYDPPIISTNEEVAAAAEEAQAVVDAAENVEGISGVIVDDSK